MKCPRCHGTGRIKPVTCYIVQIGSDNLWFTFHDGIIVFRQHVSVRSYHQALKAFKEIKTHGEYNKKRLVSISAKGHRKVLLEGRMKIIVPPGEFLRGGQEFEEGHYRGPYPRRGQR